MSRGPVIFPVGHTGTLLLLEDVFWAFVESHGKGCSGCKRRLGENKDQGAKWHCTEDNAKVILPVIVRGPMPLCWNLARGEVKSWVWWVTCPVQGYGGSLAIGGAHDVDVASHNPKFLGQNINLSSTRQDTHKHTRANAHTSPRAHSIQRRPSAT